MQMDDGTGLLAYGYVRMEEPDRTRINQLRRDLGTFCEQGGYRLGSVFVDREVTDEQFARTGFTDLLDAVHLNEASAVVVPTLDHLSPNGYPGWSEDQCGTARWRVLVVHDEAGMVRGSGADR